MNTNLFGSLYFAMRRERYCASSSSPALPTTNAMPTSPHVSSATAITAASETEGCDTSSAAISAGYTFTPPLMNNYLRRPAM